MKAAKRTSDHVSIFPCQSTKIVLYGGRFDPVHVGHGMMARFVLEEMNMDRVIWIPCADPPHKEKAGMASPEDRLAMLRLMLGGEKNMEVSEVELERGGKSYSYLTAEHFREIEPEAELYWLMGSDQWEALETWEQWERLARVVTFIVFPRPELPKPRKGVKHLSLDFRFDVSAGMIRQRFQKGLSNRYLLTPEVEHYVREKKLYTK